MNPIVISVLANVAWALTTAVSVLVVALMYRDQIGAKGFLKYWLPSLGFAYLLWFMTSAVIEEIGPYVVFLTQLILGIFLYPRCFPPHGADGAVKRWLRYFRPMVLACISHVLYHLGNMALIGVAVGASG